MIGNVIALAKSKDLVIKKESYYLLYCIIKVLKTLKCIDEAKQLLFHIDPSLLELCIRFLEATTK